MARTWAKRVGWGVCSTLRVWRRGGGYALLHSRPQLRRHGRLPNDRVSRQEDLALVEPATRALIEDTIQLHRRIARLDAAWSENFNTRPMVHNMHERLGRALGQR